MKRPVPVEVAFAAADGTCATLEGAVSYRAGDAIITGVDGECWPVGRAAFLATYTPVAPTVAGEDGRYLKRPSVVRALRLTAPVAVPVGAAGDRLDGHAGDWLVRYGAASFGVVKDTIFARTYDLMSDR